jgi:hypothetical protein
MIGMLPMDSVESLWDRITWKWCRGLAVFVTFEQLSSCQDTSYDDLIDPET